MKVRTRFLWIAFLVAIQFGGALCERNYFFEQYFSKHHRGHSTTEETLSSTSEISSEEELESSTSGYVSSEETTYLINSSGGRHRNHHMFMIKIGLVVASIVAFLCIISVIVCLCPKCCRGSEYRGYVRRSDIQTATEVLPEQPILVPYPVQQVIVQNITTQYPQDVLPHYQSQIPQQQPQRIMQQQFQHLPEKPPPYEFQPKE